MKLDQSVYNIHDGENKKGKKKNPTKNKTQGVAKMPLVFI